MVNKQKNFYSIAVIFCVIVFAAIISIISLITNPNSGHATQIATPFELNESWYVVGDDSEVEWDMLPYYNEYRFEEFKLYNYLPNDLKDRSCIYLKTNYQSIKIEIEGYGVIYDEKSFDNLVFGSNVNVVTHFIELEQEYAGKKIIISSDEVQEYLYPTLEQVLIAEKGDLLLNLLMGASIDLFFIGVIIIIGCLLIILAILLIKYKSVKYVADCFCLTIFTFIFAIWIFSNVSELYILVNDNAFFFLIYILALYMLLLPIYILLRNKCTHFIKLFDSLFTTMVCLLLNNLILAGTGVWSLTESMILLHIVIAISYSLCVFAVFVEYFKHKNRDILAYLISSVVFFVCITFTIIAYYYPNLKLNIIDYDFFLKFAFVIFVILNGIAYIRQVIISSLKTSESAIYRKLAFTDLMTGLDNRSSFDHDLNTLAQEMFDYISIIEFDIDGLKSVNDNYGHSVGDELIKEVASSIKEIFGKYSKCYRIGGDEFIVITLNENSTFIQTLIDKFKEEISNKILSSGSKINVSIGSAFDDGILSKYTNLTNLINVTDRLMYENKNINKMNNNFVE